jgi:hypothetical protein
MNYGSNRIVVLTYVWSDATTYEWAERTEVGVERILSHCNTIVMDNSRVLPHMCVNACESWAWVQFAGFYDFISIFWTACLTRDKRRLFENLNQWECYNKRRIQLRVNQRLIWQNQQWIRASCRIFPIVQRIIARICHMKVNLRKSEVPFTTFLISVLIIRSIIAGASTNGEHIRVHYFDSSAVAIDEIQILLDNDLDMTNSGQHSSCPSA